MRCVVQRNVKTRKRYSYLSQACTQRELVERELGNACTGEDGSSARVRRLQGR